MQAVCQRFGMESEVVPCIATGFGGGMGRCGAVCGAVSGGIMALGLKYGRRSPGGRPGDDPEKLRAYDLTSQLYRRFRQEMGSTLCYELTGYDLGTPEGLRAFYASDVPQKVCAKAVVAAARLAEELMASS